MEAIVVATDKLSVETLIDRKVYTVGSDVQSTFGNLSDILGVIPSVDVDPDGVVALRGDTHVLILIDGKPSTQLGGSAAGDNLQSIPAKNIERIEVLTTPPAQFKADGAAGVINIITRKKAAGGEAGSVQASLGTGDRAVVGANTAYSSPSLNVSATAGYRHDLKLRRIQSEVISFGGGTTSSVINERIHRGVPTAGLAADYQVNEKQSLNGSVTWAERGGLRTYTESNDATAPGVGIVRAAGRRSTGHDPETDVDAKLGFTQKLGRPGDTLEFSLHRSTSRQHEHYDYQDDSFVPPSPTVDSNLSFRESHATTELGADSTLALAQTRSLKFGYAFEQEDYGFDNTGITIDPTGLAVIDPNLTNDFRFKQKINSLYGSYQTSRGDWTWLAGLRGEYAATDARQLTNGVQNSASYLKAYPSLHVDYAVSDSAALSFGASRRITRPDPDNLNPYIDHEYTPNLRSGNPLLRPQYTQSYEVGYAIDGHVRSYGITGYHRRNRDSATDVTEYLGNGVSLTTKTNLPNNDSSGLEFSSSGHLSATLSYSVSGNAFYSQIDASTLGIPGLQSTFGVNAKLKLDYRPTSRDSAQLNFTRTDKRLTAQGFVSAIDIVNLGFKHRLNASLTGVATLSDAFDGQRFVRIAATPAFTETYQRSTRGRVLYVGVVYAFGRANKEKAPTFDYDQPG